MSPAAMSSNGVETSPQTATLAALSVADENYQLHSFRIVDFLIAVTSACPVMHELGQITGGVELNRVAVRRNEGWLVLTATELVVVGLIGFEILTKNVENWREYARRLGEID
jgi:hypothetical protein